MPQFMLLLHDSTTAPPDLSPEQIQAIIKRYSDWAKKLKKEKRFKGGEKLADDPGRIMRRGKGGKVVVRDGPYSETKEVMGGYFTIVADSYDAAVQLAHECPHLDYGGTIEVRQVDSH